jgi:hypothetical protein
MGPGQDYTNFDEVRFNEMAASEFGLAASLCPARHRLCGRLQERKLCETCTGSGKAHKRCGWCERSPECHGGGAAREARCARGQAPCLG